MKQKVYIAAAFAAGVFTAVLLARTSRAFQALLIRGPTPVR